MTGAELRQSRFAMGLSQEQLGRLLERTGNTISRQERGVTPVDRRTELAVEHLSTYSHGVRVSELRQAIIEDAERNRTVATDE